MRQTNALTQVQHARCSKDITLPVRVVQGEGEKRWTWCNKAYFALSAASFLQSERNFLRSLP